MTTTGRRGFVFGTLAGASAAVAASASARYFGARPPPPPPAPIAQTPEQQFGRPSFAQQGEDLVIEGILKYLKIEKPTYLDIGAADPIEANNTYKFFRQLGRGVLVEPNPVMVTKLREVRPGDTVLEAGIGVSEQKEADYYAFKDHPWLNTFSKEQADLVLAKYGAGALDKVLKRPLLNVNDVIREHFKGAAPDVFSIDIEGLDGAVLQTIDFGKYRPGVICAETMEMGTGAIEQEILTFMASKDYQVRGGSFVNTVWVDGKRVAARRGG
jgi:FkbM family methyltransferase